MLHHCSFYWSSVKSFLAICFLIIGDHFRLHFFNIRQCQLTISWVAMVTCGPIVFPKVLWMQHLRIIFDFNALDMMQIFKLGLGRVIGHPSIPLAKPLLG